MSVMEWSAAITTAVFVGLAIGLLLGMRSALKRLSALQAAAELALADAQAASLKLGALAEPAEQTLRTAQHQLQSAGKLFAAAGQIGDAVEHTTSAVSKVSSVLANSAVQHAERASKQRQIGEALEWAELGMAAWQLWQTNRKRHSAPYSEEQGE
ncbi:hypothetical protein [Paenibacillus sp. NEAU-GSW1]|uniref:hypothetical protein n=1 Tax=Paenibacillus sp. NEAU-GSW1 TaxID=2682486 RepID=UPI0012E32B1C|nr:hypothetical protein [Paenibacillus sp. NEAU-GSW1]MUT66895.1 hypothetical protein [Paenibacillus sp. NEAU-GSW1]